MDSSKTQGDRPRPSVLPIALEANTARTVYGAGCSVVLDYQDFEAVLVSDGGRDLTWDFLCKLSTADPRVKGIKFTANSIDIWQSRQAATYAMETERW